MLAPRGPGPGQASRTLTAAVRLGGILAEGPVSAAATAMRAVPAFGRQISNAASRTPLAPVGRAEHAAVRWTPSMRPRLLLPGSPASRTSGARRASAVASLRPFPRFAPPLSETQDPRGRPPFALDSDAPPPAGSDGDGLGGADSAAPPADGTGGGDDRSGKSGKGRRRAPAKTQDAEKPEEERPKGVKADQDGEPAEEAPAQIVEDIKGLASLSGSEAASGALVAGGDGSSNVPDKVQIPKDYPQLLAIPLTRRPLFPGFYKTVYIKDPQVIAAVHDLVARRQAYVGVFMTKDDNFEPDVITDVDQIHPVGVFAQIANVYASGPDNSGLTVLLYPHRRIRVKSLVPLPRTGAALKAEVADEQSGQDQVSLPGDVDVIPDPFSNYIPINLPLSKFAAALVNVENLADEPYNADNPLIKAITNEMLNVMKEISQLNPLFRDQIITFSIQSGGSLLTEPSRLADFAAAVSSAEPAELQAILESMVVEERLHKSLHVVKKELANAKLQQEIAKEVDKKITRKQQEYFLMEQLKGIKKELGIDSDGKDKLIEKFKERAAKLSMPEAVQKVFDEEIQKLSTLESAASEFNVTRNYLDWITNIPWGRFATENFDIKHAVAVLDEDHYGLKEVKDRILEFIAVGKLRGTVEGKIICLVGPPGVGKTSIGKSIARALQRDFYRFSVGGLSDVAEIKGHRRTYVGAMPGKVVQALKKVQSQNPLILIDEIDKLGRGHQGDPASALLEVLDPEQNNSFLDHYMDVPIDLSKVLFVCTANLLDTIPAPLLDRMEVIQLSGYVAEEKVAIAEKYLAPQAREAAGLQDTKVEIKKDAIEALIKFYCRESGVRNLKKHIDKVYRKAALRIVNDQTNTDVEEARAMIAQARADLAKDVGGASSTPVTVQVGDTTVTAPAPKKPTHGLGYDKTLVIDSENLKDFVGSPVYTSDRMYETTPPGVVMGLAWTSMGGSALYVESVLEAPLVADGKPSFSRTGQMGDVMKESSAIAYTYSKSFLARKFPDNKFFERAAIHLHVPEGATPKDGPSAGVTMTTSLLSLALNEPVIPNVAMTGELTLTGKVLKIGGLREKTIAAKRSGVTNIIFPAPNRNDWDELPDYIREGVNGIPVENYEDIFKIVFAQAGNSLKVENEGKGFNTIGTPISIQAPLGG
ncbi:Lon protease C-terminal proteolytic domain-containing protein [Hyaloraphidium curvatum]|nr:Lon protease C-terminal proteolytic domain-containing protein [Hyaloraphidium curvatum]